MDKINFTTAAISLQYAGRKPCIANKSIQKLLLEQNSSPYLFSFPHSGRHYNTQFVKNSKLDALSLRSSEDAFVDQLFKDVTSQGGNKLVALFPRAFVDVNRSANELDPLLIIEDIVHNNSVMVKSGIGIIPRKVANNLDIYSAKLSITEVNQRLKTHYYPYHMIIQNLINSAQVNFGYSVLVDCHSMPAQFSPTHQAPDFIIGNLHNKSCDEVISQTIYEFLLHAGFKIRFNQPYAGGTITKKYHDLAKGQHSIQIEINRGLYMHEKKIQKNSNFDALQTVLTNLTKKITQIAPKHLFRVQNAAQ